ncbi:GL26681 [Drosophila persimilis]|uniref:GL26681 n=1 Tax=Drosophila persimilis TaxID=7234 RepID=B4GT86_DROPE|nr:GL26681 [Drosophila persimilis]
MAKDLKRDATTTCGWDGGRRQATSLSLVKPNVGQAMLQQQQQQQQPQPQLWVPAIDAVPSSAEARENQLSAQPPSAVSALEYESAPSSAADYVQTMSRQVDDGDDWQAVMGAADKALGQTECGLGQNVEPRDRSRGWDGWMDAICMGVTRK